MNSTDDMWTYTDVTTRLPVPHSAILRDDAWMRIRIRMLDAGIEAVKQELDRVAFTPGADVGGQR